MENLGHLEGMLDRDQRTAKLRFFNSDRQVPKTYSFPDKTVNESSPNPSSIISHHCCCPARTKRSNSSYLPWKNGYLLDSVQSLKNVLIVGVCLTLVTFPSVSSAPTNLKMSSRMKEQPKWINPCGITQANTDLSPDNNSPGLRDIGDGVLLSQIVDQAKIAFHQTEGFKYQFAQKTFEMDFDSVHQLFKAHNVDWLNNLVPKSLGEEIPQDHLDDLKVDDTLLKVYEFLQRVAVGLEQIVWDQEDKQGQFTKEFGEAEQHLRNVLCELQMAIIDHGLKMRPDITRDVMKDGNRNVDITESKARDWMIFREYMNILEYIIKAFTHMNKL